jgi:hypothetical protein
MSRVTIVRVLAGLALMALSLGAGAQKSLYSVEEYNAFVDTTRGEPAERLATIDTFLKNYPNSVLRALVFPAQAQLAFQVKQYEKAMGAVDAYLAMDREQVNAILTQSGYNELQIEGSYYSSVLTHSSAYLQLSGTSPARAQALSDNAARVARRGLELHDRIYAQVQPPTDPAQLKQFEAQRQQSEATFRIILADAAYRGKNWPESAKQYAAMVKVNPNDAVLNYRLGLSYLQSQPPQWEPGLWHVARSVALNIAKADEVKDFLSKNVAAYQQVLPECSKDQVDDLVAQAALSPEPPAGWRLVSSEQVSAVRSDLTLKRIFDDLKAGGEQEHIIWLASCGLELPELEAEVVEVAQNEGNVVTLGVAVTAESADAKKADMVVKVVSPPEARNIKVGDLVHITGTLRSYQKDPAFQLVLDEGRIKPEDIPKTRGGRSGAGRGGSR